jgi:hypothetical protein
MRARRRLKAREIESLPAGTHEDGDGLRLVVDPSGARRWILRVTINGKRRHRGLGGFPLVGLEARGQTIDARRAARKGLDIARRAPAGTTFRKAFEAHFALRKKGMSNAKHIWQWRAGIETHAFP